MFPEVAFFVVEDCGVLVAFAFWLEELVVALLVEVEDCGVLVAFVFWFEELVAVLLVVVVVVLFVEVLFRVFELFCVLWVFVLVLLWVLVLFAELLFAGSDPEREVLLSVLTAALFL